MEHPLSPVRDDLCQHSSGKDISLWGDLTNGTSLHSQCMCVVRGEVDGGEGGWQQAKCLNTAVMDVGKNTVKWLQRDPSTHQPTHPPPSPPHLILSSYSLLPPIRGSALKDSKAHFSVWKKKKEGGGGRRKKIMRPKNQKKKKTGKGQRKNKKWDELPVKWDGHAPSPKLEWYI